MSDEAVAMNKVCVGCLEYRSNASFRAMVSFELRKGMCGTAPAFAAVPFASVLEEEGEVLARMQFLSVIRLVLIATVSAILVALLAASLSLAEEEEEGE